MNEQPEKKLICPNCGNSLKEVYAEANYGRILLLDQCDKCGGVWFDNWELYYLKDAEAKKLDTINIDSFLAQSSVEKGTGFCPKCDGFPLQLFQDPNLPEDSKIDRCGRCNGLWLNRGEMVKYEDHKHKLHAILEINETGTPTAQYVPAVDNQKAKWETVSHLSKAINTKPELSSDIVLSGDTNWDKSQISKDALFLILQILFKVIFKI